VSYRVRFTRQALADLDRLYAFVLEREMERAGNFELVERALEAIEAGIAMLRYSPFTCRKAGHGPFIRELVIPFGHSGYVALFEQRHRIDRGHSSSARRRLPLTPD